MANLGSELIPGDIRGYISVWTQIQIFWKIARENLSEMNSVSFHEKDLTTILLGIQGITRQAI